MALWTPALFALELLTIAPDFTLDWSILRSMILRIFHLMMATSMLFVSRSEEFSSAHINILDCTSFDTLPNGHGMAMEAATKIPRGLVIIILEIPALSYI